MYTNISFSDFNSMVVSVSLKEGGHRLPLSVWFVKKFANVGNLWKARWLDALHLNLVLLVVQIDVARSQ